MSFNLHDENRKVIGVIGLILAYGLSSGSSGTAPNIIERRNQQVIDPSEQIDKNENQNLERTIQKIIDAQQIENWNGTAEDLVRPLLGEAGKIIGILIDEMIGKRSYIIADRFSWIKTHQRVKDKYYGFVRQGKNPSLERHIEQLGPYTNSVKKYSARFGVPYDLGLALALAESGGDPKAVSSAGAKGLYQLTGIARKELNGKRSKRYGLRKDECTDPFDPEQNIKCGLALYGKLLKGAKRRHPKWDLQRKVAEASAIYNAGNGPYYKALKRYNTSNIFDVPAGKDPAQSGALAARVLATMFYLHRHHPEMFEEFRERNS
jgi:soluble lytic murein transglycosylase-like protein